MERLAPFFPSDFSLTGFFHLPGSGAAFSFTNSPANNCRRRIVKGCIGSELPTDCFDDATA